MRNRQTARNDAGNRVQLFTNAHAAELTTIPEYAAEKTDLDNTIAKLEAAEQAQLKDTSGHSQSKAALRAVMGETIVIYTSRAVVFARRLGNNALAEQLDHSVSFYTVGPAATALTRAKDTADLLRNSLATVTNITVANIATIDGVIKAFEDYKELPGIENLNKKVHGTNLIDPLLDEMDIYIDHIEALVNSYFPKSELADELALTSRVSLLGIRHNAVTVHFTDADTAAIITTATATHIASGKTAAADASGTAYFERISQGIQNFSAAANGYTTQNFSAKISRGTNTDVVVAMKKA